MDKNKFMLHDLQIHPGDLTLSQERGSGSAVTAVELGFITLHHDPHVLITYSDDHKACYTGGRKYLYAF